MRFVTQTDNGRTILIPGALLDSSDKLATKRISQIPSIPEIEMNPNFTYDKTLQQTLQGKRLLLDDLQFSLKTIHEHYLHGYILFQAGILQQNESYKCLRCGNDKQHLFASFPCARCHEPCTYCRSCILMGRVSECTPLITWKGPFTKVEIPATILHWDGQLSAGQQVAADQVVASIENKEDLLVWAVCGSGKTEVLFPGIEHALKSGKRVCIATPRTDVVHELTPRMKAALPETEVISLYGGSDDRTKTAQLTIATTHQLLRYYHWFDAIIIDEVDAFPFSVDQTFVYILKNARKQGAPTIYLTATPDRHYKKRVKAAELKHVMIPARYHRHPLPVPRFQWCGNWQKAINNRRLPAVLRKWIITLDNKQAFLFVPNVEILNEVVRLLQNSNPAIEGVHAADRERKNKVDSFRAGTIPILVTTTILERGVTVPNIDVAVFGAEDHIFTESALVQIAGRVGRSRDYPNGDVVFMHYGKTTAMVAARRHIQKMNAEAREQGYIDGEC